MNPQVVAASNRAYKSETQHDTSYSENETKARMRRTTMLGGKGAFGKPLHTV